MKNVIIVLVLVLIFSLFFINKNIEAANKRLNINKIAFDDNQGSDFYVIDDNEKGVSCYFIRWNAPYLQCIKIK